MKKVGLILKKARREKGLELEEASKELRIQRKFLEALEKGNYDIFDSVVHIKGFLRNYADFLDLKPEQVLAFWRREFDKHEFKPEIRQLPAKPLKKPKQIITPGLATLLGIIILSLGFFGYLFWQYRSLTGPPKLVVDYPNDNERFSENYIQTTGKADPNAELYINEQRISLKEDGSFSVPLALSTGLNTIVFTAKSDLGSNQELVRTVFVTPEEEQDRTATTEATPSAQPQLEGDKEMDLKIKAEPNSIWLEVKSGEEVLFQGMLISGAETTFSTNKQVLIKSGNAGSTHIILNNEDQGVLGEEGEVTEKEFAP